MKRKIASAMCLVMMGVNFVAPVYADGITGSTSTSGGASGSGSTTYVSTKHYSVVVPTNASLGFQLDPQGLLSVAKGQSTDVKDINTSVAGAIYGTDALIFANLGTDNIRITSTFTLDDQGADAEVVAPGTSVQQDPSQNSSAWNVKFALVPFTTTKGDNGFEATNTPIKASDATVGIPFGCHGAPAEGQTEPAQDNEFTFDLEHPDWRITNNSTDQNPNKYDLEVIEDTNNKAVAFRLGGECNSKADWSKFVPQGSNATAAKKIKLNAAFTITDGATGNPDVAIGLGDETHDPSIEAKKSGMILLPVKLLNEASAAETATATVSGRDITIDVTDLDDTSIVVTTGTGEDVDTLTADTHYTVDTDTEGKLKITLTELPEDDTEYSIAYTDGDTNYVATAIVYAEIPAEATAEGNVISISGFTGEASDVSVTIDDENPATVETDYTVEAGSGSLTVTLTENSTEDRNVVVTFIAGGKTYVTNVVTVEKASVVKSDGTNDIVIFDENISTGDTITITPISINGTNMKAITRTVAANSTDIAIEAGESLTIKASWINTLIESATRGKGTYSVKIGSETTTTTITFK